MKFALTALVALALPLTTFADTGLSARGLAHILISKSVQKVLKGRSIEKLEVEPIAATETGGFLISVTASEVGLSPAGPSTHPCMITITASRPKYDTQAAYSIDAREVCAMSAPMPVTQPAQ